MIKRCVMSNKKVFNETIRPELAKQAQKNDEGCSTQGYTVRAVPTNKDEFLEILNSGSFGEVDEAIPPQSPGELFAEKYESIPPGIGQSEPGPVGFAGIYQERVYQEKPRNFIKPSLKKRTVGSFKDNEMPEVMASDLSDDPGDPVMDYISCEEEPIPPKRTRDIVNVNQVPEFEDLIRENLRFTRIGERTNISVIAIDRGDSSKNGYARIKCMGEALGGYSYDSTKDTYEVRCCDVLNLGSVAVAYQMQMENNSSWQVPVLLPDDLVIRCMSPNQRKALQQFKAKFPDEKRYAIQFVQSTDC